VPNPVETLVRTSRRIAQVTAARTLAYAILPALVAAALAASLRPLGHATWERWGYVLGAAQAAILADSLITVAIVALVAGAAFALREYQRARDFVAAAEKVDDAVGSHQQILTFATLADPAAPETAKAKRSPLFPLLWKSAASFLESFDPNRAFPLRLGRSITRSSVLAFVVALATALATFGLIHPPTPLEAQAARLREIANEIEKSSTSPDDLALATSVRDAADALENPNLPPEAKKQRLEQVMQQMASHADQKQGGGKEKGGGSGSGGSSKVAKGSGQPGQGAGTSNASGNNGGGGGSGQNQQAKGAGSNDNGNQGKDKQSIELQNEIAKAEAQLESEGAKSPNNGSGPGKDQTKEDNQQAGNKPNEKMAGNEPNPSQPGNLPKQGEGNRNLPQTGGNQQQAAKDQGSNMGDTHLGEFPTPVKTQRFLKPGEKGEALDIHDARYVMFRLPGATPVGPGGITVIDPNRAKASTPYVNAPLKETSNDAPPDERQLVPPRYRDLIH